MSRARTVMFLLLCLTPAGSTRAESPPEGAAQKRRLAALAKTDPERFARLTRDLQVFLRLSPQDQGRLRDLDRDLKGEDSERQARLLRVLERYADWLQRLPEADRDAVESAPDARERLRRIKEIRERQWIERLPRADQDRLRRLQGAERQALVRELRQKERKDREDWQKAVRNWPNLYKGPPILSVKDLPPEARNFVHKQLMPELSADEKKALQAVEGKPEFLRTLTGLVRKHHGRLQRPFLNAWHE